MDYEISGEELTKKVQELSGQDIFSCYQCGICTGSCPFAAEMDLGPRRMIACLIEGRTEVLESNTPWICASCFQCVVRCPNDIDIAAVSEALRQITQRRGIDHIDPSLVSREKRVGIPQIAFVGNFRRMTR
jgi:heterodisulfide reductase subunit C2